jgi:predicted nucleic acid-binding protein
VTPLIHAIYENGVFRPTEPVKLPEGVLYECGNAAARRPYRSTVDDLRTWLTAKGWLIEPNASDLNTAWTDYRAAAAGQAGIVDYVSLVVMRRLGLTEAFTNDRHFQTAGFTLLF